VENWTNIWIQTKKNKLLASSLCFLSTSAITVYEHVHSAKQASRISECE